MLSNTLTLFCYLSFGSLSYNNLKNNIQGKTYRFSSLTNFILHEKNVKNAKQLSIGGIKPKIYLKLKTRTPLKYIKFIVGLSEIEIRKKKQKILDLCKVGYLLNIISFGSFSKF